MQPNNNQQLPPGMGQHPVTGQSMPSAPAQEMFIPHNNQSAAGVAHQHRDAAIRAATQPTRPQTPPGGHVPTTPQVQLPEIRPTSPDEVNQATGPLTPPPTMPASAHATQPSAPAPLSHAASPSVTMPFPPTPANTARPHAPLPAVPMAPPAEAPAIPGQAVAPKQQQAPPPKSNPNSTQNALEIAEIRDGIVIMNDGSFRAVVMARSINFDLMSPQEREGVEYSYQGFLNSLYFTTQILMRSRKVDMRPYLEKLNKIRQEQDNMLLAMLMEDYIYYISQLVEQTNIMNKQFYVIVPYYTELSGKQALGETRSLLGGVFGSKKTQLTIDEEKLIKAKTELQNRVQSVMNGLIQLGVQAAPLDTQELIELYYDVYNPDTATREPLGDFNNLSSIVVGKGQGEAPQPHLDQGII